MDDRELSALVDDLTRIRAAAVDLFGLPVRGVRAVEVRPGARTYLCALEDDTVAVLDDAGASVTDGEVRRRTLTAALLIEQVEELLDAVELRSLAVIALRAQGVMSDRAVAGALGGLAQAAEHLAEWRDDPGRAVASVIALDVAVTRHEAARRGYDAFVAATDPLVPVQDTLPDAVRDALRDVEHAAGSARVAGQLTGLLVSAMEGVDQGAGELLDRSRTPSG